MKFTDADWEAMLYRRENVLGAVHSILTEPAPVGQSGTPEERLADLVIRAQRDGVNQGVRAVQQAMISALDLRHLLGLH